jgi:hypothetical protein
LQNSNDKRFLSTTIEKDGDMFYCIALTNSSEVVIINEEGTSYVRVSSGRLFVSIDAA